MVSRFYFSLLIALLTLSTLCASKKVQGKQFLVMARAHHEQPYYRSFVQWYLDLGFHHVFILQTDGMEQLTWSNASEVTIVKDVGSPNPNVRLVEYAKIIRGTYFEWVLLVDIDEFLLLDRSKYNNISHYVATMEAKVGCAVDVVQFRWAVLENVEPRCSSDPLSHMLHSNRLFANHHVKSMTRIKRLATFANAYCPVLLSRANRTVHLRSASKCHPTLPNVLIDGNVLHSVGTHVKPTATHASVDAALVHVHTRSLANMVLKAATTRLPQKTLQNSTKLLDLLLSPQPPVLDRFIAIIGLKASLPLHHSKRGPFNDSLLLRSLSKSPPAMVSSDLSSQYPSLSLSATQSFCNISREAVSMTILVHKLCQQALGATQSATQSSSTLHKKKGDNYTQQPSANFMNRTNDRSGTVNSVARRFDCRKDDAATIAQHFLDTTAPHLSQLYLQQATLTRSSKQVPTLA